MKTETSPAMELLPLLCLCLLTRSGVTSAQLNGPTVITVEGGADAVLPCSLSTKENIEYKLLQWRKVPWNNYGRKEVFLYNGGKHYNNGFDGQSEEFKERVSHFQGELEHGNASIIIRNTKISDSGEYTCEFPNLEPPQTFYIELVVVDHTLKDRSGLNIPGFAPKPSITSLKETKVWSLLQCEVHGNPKPEVEWQDSAGNKLPAEESQVTEKRGLFYITLNTTVTKRGRYRCNATQKTISHQVYAETDVYISGPDDKVTVVEDSDVILPCSLSTKENIESKEFHWKKVAQKDPTNVLVYNGRIDNNLQHKEFKGRVFHFQDELKHGNASIIIRNTTISDSGVYTCDFPNPQPSQTFYIELVVGPVLKDRRRENSGVSLEPSVTSLEVTKNWARLQCKVKGASPKPEVEWQDSDGNKLPAEERPVSNPGGPDDIILLTTVTKTDNYRCVVTQREFNHQTASQIHVYIQEFSTGWTVGLVLLALVGLAVLVYMGYIILNRNKESPTGWTVGLVLAGVLAVLVYMGYITFSHNEEFSTGWTVGLVLLALLALVALVDLIGLVCKRCIPLNCNKEFSTGWIVALVLAGVLAVLVYMGYITFSHNEGSPTGWTVDLVLLALVAVVALVVLAVLVYKRCNPLKHNKGPGTVQMQPQEKPSCDPENQSSSTHTYEIPNHVRGQKQNPSCGSTPEPNALHPFMMEERL